MELDNPRRYKLKQFVAISRKSRKIVEVLPALEEDPKRYLASMNATLQNQADYHEDIKPVSFVSEHSVKPKDGLAIYLVDKSFLWKMKGKYDVPKDRDSLEVINSIVDTADNAMRGSTFVGIIA